jgi:hypothetical protein
MHIMGVKKYIILATVLIIYSVNINTLAIAESALGIKLYQSASQNSPLIGHLKNKFNASQCNINQQWDYITNVGFIIKDAWHKNCEIIDIDIKNLDIYDNIAIGNHGYYLCQNQIGQLGWENLVINLEYKGQINCHLPNIDNVNANNSTITNKPSSIKTTQPTTASETNISPKQLSASQWALKQVGKKYKDNGSPWDGWCDLFVASAYGRKNSGHTTAYKHYQYLLSKGWINNSTDVPTGGLAFFAPIKGNSAGHVMISIGNGNFVSSGKIVFITTLNISGTGKYLGWAYDKDWQK